MIYFNKCFHKKSRENLMILKIKFKGDVIFIYFADAYTPYFGVNFNVISGLV